MGAEFMSGSEPPRGKSSLQELTGCPPSEGRNSATRGADSLPLFREDNVTAVAATPSVDLIDATEDRGRDPLAALCVIARLHQVAAEPAALRHALGKAASEPIATADLLLAARHLGLKARRNTTSLARLNLAPLPALARLQDGRWGSCSRSPARR
jgi:hypothetical protein